jgi:N-terminal acetyltransferase B complex non-catalytic subunit
MIDKARNDTPADTTIIPARAIQTSQEVSLLLELLSYVAPGDANKEALDVLNSENLGVDSTIGGGDWWGLARKRLDLLESTEDWRSLFETCKTLLPKPQKAAETNGNGEASKDEEKSDEKPEGVQGRGDDWRVWDGFVLAAGKLYDDGDKPVAKESLEKILEHRKALPAGSSRHGDLALVKFSSLFHDKNDGPEGTPTLLEAVEEYFVNTGNKSCCFEDIQVYLEMLEDSEKKDFLKYVEGKVERLPEENEVSCYDWYFIEIRLTLPQKQKIDKVASTINYQKFVYLLTISLLSEAATTTTKTITSFITNTLKIYVFALSLGSSLLVTDNQYGDDAALLSVMGLVRLYTLTPSDQAPLYQSIQILKSLLQKSKHNYQALLLLVRVYLLIGAIGSALDIYPRLNIKQIQNDTLSHFMLTRISTLFPNDARTAAFLNDAGGIYESSRAQTPNMLQLAFERGGYSQMMGFLEFSERVAGSVCRSMYEVELRRLARLSPGYPDSGTVTEVGHKSTVWDNRDFSVVVDCELSSVASFEKSFRPGPTPAENWVRAFVAAEEVIQFLTAYAAAGKEANGTAAGSGEKPKPEDNLAGRLAVALEAGERAGEFTNAEKSYLLLVGAMAELAAAATKKDSEAVSKSLEGITADLFPKILNSTTTETPAWGLLHTLWMGKDAAIVSEGLVVFLNAVKGLKPNFPKAAITALGEAAKKRKSEVVTIAQEAQKNLEDEDRVQALVDAVLAQEGVGGILRKEEGVFGGVELVAESVKRVIGGVVKCFESV